MEIVTPTERAELAKFYCCHERTLRRLESRLIDIRDPAAVAEAIVETRNPSRPMAERILDLISQ